jgi:XTP/dITP diphosphohydrolase
MDLLIGTSNEGKLREYQELLVELDARLLNLTDVGLADMQVAEDAATLEENAGQKARAYARASGLVTLADDTGLFVDALGGAPGVYPARYGGPGLTMQQRRQKLLSELEGVPDEQRTARFKCVIAIADPLSETVTTVSGDCEGKVAQTESEGASGFGYDALFIPAGYDLPWSQVPRAEKSAISHRGQAARRALKVLQKMIEG